jgi:hypothetical protein
MAGKKRDVRELAVKNSVAGGGIMRKRVGRDMERPRCGVELAELGGFGTGF